MTIAWVLGSAGLLGTALCRAVRQDGTALFSPIERFSWGRPTELHEQIGAAVRAFAVRALQQDRWEIHWSAGIGTMSSPAESLAPETAAFVSFLESLRREPRLMAMPGSVSFASSAGAIYAGSSDDIITEQSSPAPTTAYAIEKIRQEELLRQFVSAHPGMSALLARITTIYGPGQASGKKQGLLGYIARNIIRNQPIQIFVPYDTIRDYIHSDDAARVIVGTLRAKGEASRVLTKIVASEQPATIAEIISIFARLARRKPLVVRGANKLTSLYTRRVQFKSVYSAGYVRTPGKRLPIGIAQLMQAEHCAFVRSSGGP